MESLPEPSASGRAKSDSAANSFSRTSVSELASITDHYRATGRLRRETQSQAESGSRPSPFQVLNKTLSARLNNLDLFDEARCSVIQYTPSRAPATSTPSNSPPPPLPPRQCQSVGPPVHPRNRSHSPACSELSSISGSEVFDVETELSSQSALPLYLRAPGTPFPPPNIIVTDTTMEAAEKSVRSKMRKLTIKMKSYNVNQLSAGSLERHWQNIDEVRALYEDLIKSIEELCEDFQAELQTAQKLDHWKDQPPIIDRDFQAYIASFSSKLDQLNSLVSPAVPQPAPLDQFQVQQLHLLKQQNEISQSRIDAAHNESVIELEAKKNAAKRKANSKRDAILTQIEDLSDKVSEVGDWSEESDLSVSRGMRNLTKWNKELEKITTMFHEFSEIYSTYDLTENDVEMSSTQLMVNKISKEVKDANKSLEEEDNVRELYTLDSAIADKVKLPTFEGKDDEDYARFKADMEKGFVQNRVTRVDKISKLRECLRGHAKKLVPDSITQDIDEAWAVLDKAYGDPVSLMKSRTEALSKMDQLPRENGKKGIQGQVESYIELESLLQNMLVLGRSSIKLGMIVFQPLSSMMSTTCSLHLLLIS